MENNNSQPNDKQVPAQNELTAPPAPSAPRQTQNSDAGAFLMIQKYAAIVMIISAILFALIGVLATWSVFGEDTGDVIWRAFSSLGIIAFAGLVVNVASRSMSSHR